MKKLEIPEKELRELYLEKEMSSNELADEFSCSKRTILKRLREYNIPRRKPGLERRDDITKEVLEKLYIREELSTREIAGKLDTGRSTVYRKLKKYEIPTRDISESHIKYERKPFSGDQTEKYYLLGFGIGDLRTRKVGEQSKTVKVDCGSTREEQIQLFRDLFEDYGRIWEGGPYEDESRHIEAFLDDSFEFLLDAREKLDSLPENREYFLAFLAGFIDAEGSFFITQKKAKFALGNYDKDLLEKLKRRLENLDIEPTRIYLNEERYEIEDTYTRNDDYKLFQINRKDSLLKIVELISPYVKHDGKKKQMKKVKENISNRNGEQT
jgi:predicted DNA-binding protein YlxM (UPF0122 family)